jgi:hypothetical protein
VTLPLRELLAAFRERGVRLGIDAEGLYADAPAGALTPELRAAHRARRGQLRVLAERRGLAPGPLGVLVVADGAGAPAGALAGGDAPPCAACGHPAERSSPEGDPVCPTHLAAPYLDRAAVEEATAELEDEAQRRARGDRLPQTPPRYRMTGAPSPPTPPPPPAAPAPAPRPLPAGRVDAQGRRLCEACPAEDPALAVRLVVCRTFPDGYGVCERHGKTVPRRWPK